MRYVRGLVAESRRDPLEPLLEVEMAPGRRDQCASWMEHVSLAGLLDLQRRRMIQPLRERSRETHRHMLNDRERERKRGGNPVEDELDRLGTPGRRPDADHADVGGKLDLRPGLVACRGSELASGPLRDVDPTDEGGFHL